MVWILFIAIVLVFIALDLGVFHKEAHVVGVKEAGLWTAVWVSVALAFSAVIYYLYDNDLINNPSNLSASEATLKYISGYLIELSLSMDNIFVIAVIFSTFKIPPINQHRVLFWGIIGAIVFRAIMIAFGIALINQFSWMIYVFGFFLLFTAYKMFTTTEEEHFDPKKSFVFKQLRKLFPITHEIEGEHFFVKKRHIMAATPLFVALIIIEVTDILFAIDSIPAILAITSDPFLVFSSNILAILGLRSMYFFLSNALSRFHHLENSLIFILSFVGVKMLLAHHIQLPDWLSFVVILVALSIGILSSIRDQRVR